MDLAELLAEARKRGYTHVFDCDEGGLHCPDRRERYRPADCRIVDSRSVDTGTDPGDDATIYLIEAQGGLRGYLIVSDSFHADPCKAALIDELSRRGG